MRPVDGTSQSRLIDLPTKSVNCRNNICCPHMLHAADSPEAVSNWNWSLDSREVMHRTTSEHANSRAILAVIDCVQIYRATSENFTQFSRMHTAASKNTQMPMPRNQQPKQLQLKPFKFWGSEFGRIPEMWWEITKIQCKLREQQRWFLQGGWASHCDPNV